MIRRKVIGSIALALFLASIPASNAWLKSYGFWTAPILGPLPSALWIVALSFILRDVAQVTIGKSLAWSAIIVGAVISVWIASPALAIASGAAFLISESTDAAIFTPLANRGRFLLGITVSGYAAGFLDSAVFLRIAFGSFEGWWQLGIAKAIVIAIAAPVALGARRALLR